MHFRSRKGKAIRNSAIALAGLFARQSKMLRAGAGRENLWLILHIFNHDLNAVFSARPNPVNKHSLPFGNFHLIKQTKPTS
jgi:hypothetical protein